MTTTGQILNPDLPVVSVALDLEREQGSPHTHPRAQLLYSIQGVMRVVTSLGTWLVPSTQAVWIPSMIEHQVIANEAIAIRSIYVDPAWTEGLPTQCCVIAVSELLRALILRAVKIGNSYPPAGPERRLMDVILDELRVIKSAPLHLPMPKHPRVRKVIDALVNQPEDSRTITQWAAVVGSSPRTLSRLFMKQTGMSFGAWRRRLRLMEAIDRLAKGESVTQVAFELGYQSTSAFSAMFRSELGVSPKSYSLQESG
ncbi:MAG: helix-turn-helix transcriptional regulator [Sedimenticola sp.]|nr:helix-turn-helix transcriptional regulator [Sedimenticola sp.]MCW8920300.1 helix-turn-helix transcriptional regulator [Sedimenticola sp.]MCW8948723.1 helix-turn-helix transcriptional regulator [Sedimenticola sp.]MCW8976142.1 helix-turn-helix transcriptional regulator [Sedimenticola sp.]